MKNVIFNGDINEALNLIKKDFNYNERFIENLKNNAKSKKLTLIIFTLSTFLFCTSPFLIQLFLGPVALVSGFDSFKNIIVKGFIDTYKEKKKFSKEKEQAKRILDSFKRNVLVKANIFVKEDCYLKNIGTYSKKKIVENIRIKYEEKTTNSYFKFKDRRGRLHVLRQIKKELLENGISQKNISTDYELLDLKEADFELKKEKGKIR